MEGHVHLGCPSALQWGSCQPAGVAMILQFPCSVAPQLLQSETGLPSDGGAGVTGAGRPRAGVPAHSPEAPSAKPQNPVASLWDMAGLGDPNPSLSPPASLKLPPQSTSWQMLLLNSWLLSEIFPQSPSLYPWICFNSHLAFFNFLKALPHPQHHFLWITAREWETVSSFYQRGD